MAQYRRQPWRVGIHREAEMRHDRRRQRSPRRTLWALLQIVGHVLAPRRRRWRLRWGARPGEPDPSLPGEDLIPDPDWSYTHAVTIAASPEEVWPWVAQIGQARGGFYSFELLENVFGCRITNADAILPEHQSLHVGDQIRLHPSAPAMTVAVVEPSRALVLRGVPTERAPGAAESIWAFHLIAEGPGRCRLIERGKTVHADSLTDRLFFSPVLVEPIGFVMSREMLLGIKERAEQVGA
jgi:hypothetical protein